MQIMEHLLGKIIITHIVTLFQNNLLFTTTTNTPGTKINTDSSTNTPDTSTNTSETKTNIPDIMSNTHDTTTATSTINIITNTTSIIQFFYSSYSHIFLLVSSRPKTSTGRPISGVARPGTQTRPGSALDRLKTARPITSKSARAIRLGTAAMLTQKDGPFIQISRLNIAKYAQNQQLSKPLFEYLFYHEGDVRNALELAVQATQACQFKDWWWKVQIAKCYVALNLIRDAEQQLRSALKQHHNVETFIRLMRIYIRLDQPLSAKDICKAGLEVFPNDVSLSTELARLYEGLMDSPTSVKYYRSVVIEDAMNVEAIACIGVYHFYNNQPELALRYYR